MLIWTISYKLWKIIQYTFISALAKSKENSVDLDLMLEKEMFLQIG